MILYTFFFIKTLIRALSFEKSFYIFNKTIEFDINVIISLCKQTALFLKK